MKKGAEPLVRNLLLPDLTASGNDCITPARLHALPDQFVQHLMHLVVVLLVLFYDLEMHQYSVRVVCILHLRLCQVRLVDIGHLRICIV